MSQITTIPALQRMRRQCSGKVQWANICSRTGRLISETKLEAKIGQTIQVIVDEIDEDAATCRTMADAPEIDGNLFIDQGFEALKPGDIVSVAVDEAGEYDLWGKLAY